MCGIAGVYCKSGGLPSKVGRDLLAASNALTHRGPDDRGEITSGRFHAAHTRLSIIDLAGGQQPMADPDRGTVIVFNGEIYNYLELRRDLEARGYSFRTSSDTEVILKSYCHYGMDMLQHFNGMFSFALFDEHTDDLFLARDRFGEKPLFYFSTPDRVYLASQLDALLQFDECPGALRRQPCSSTSR